MAAQLTPYRWEGFNAQGQREKGQINAGSPALAQAELKKQGITVYNIMPKSFSLFNFLQQKKKIHLLDILLFTRQLSTMLAAGLSLVKAFDIVGEGHENPSMEELIAKIKERTAAGNTLAETLSEYPQYFDNLYCSLIHVGERSGTLDVMLERIATYLEKTQTLKKKVKKAIMYPSVVLSATFAAAGILLLFVVPRFQVMFSSFGADLPAFTRIIMNLSQFLQRYWWLILLIVIGGTWGFITAKKRSPRFAYLLDKFTLHLPVLGPITQKAIIARFTRTLATTMAAGMPIVDALECVNNVIDNRIYKNAVIRLRSEVASGQSISATLTQLHLFPNLVVKMIAVGEESGSLESMLNKVASYFEEDVDSMVDNLSALLEPMIMVILGVIIGGFVIAMYLPIFRLGAVMK